MCSDSQFIGESNNGVVTGHQLLSWCARNMKDELGTATGSGRSNRTTRGSRGEGGRNNSSGSNSGQR